MANVRASGGTHVAIAFANAGHPAPSPTASALRKKPRLMGPVASAVDMPARDHQLIASVSPRPFITTANVTTDFAGSAKVGDWIEAHVNVQKVGRTLAFANCYVVCEGRRIVHASGIFSVQKAERTA